ncbi:General secretion pathway protein G [gamma proteobacterium IMCC2047]|nr:General secretion pathway protein G [gamma proteobacterium IMCC2047]
MPKDGWGNEYQYLSPGAHGRFDLYSLGADGREGGEGIDADITSWESAQ